MHPGSCGALILCVFDSQLSGSERCEPQRDLFVHHGPENAGTAARHASPSSLGVDTKMFHHRSSGPDVGTLVCCFSCIMWFKGMFGTDWEKNKKKIPPLIAFHKCQENLQDRGLCDRATAEERLSGGGGGGSAKRLHVLQGLFRFPIWHFLYDDDDFNAPDVIMSRIFSSVDVRGVAFRGSSLSNPFGIQRDLPPTWRNYKQTRAGFIARSCFYIYFTPRWSERV